MSLALLPLLAVPVVWGIYYVVLERAMGVFAPHHLLLACCLGGLFLGGTLTLRDAAQATLPAAPINAWAWVIAAALLSGLGSWLTMNGIHGSGARSFAAVEVSYPIFVGLFAWMLFGRAPDWRLAAGALLVLAGIALILSAPER